MRIQQKTPFEIGYNSITNLQGEHSDMMMDFGILKLEKGTVFQDDTTLERVFVLLSGKIRVSWDGKTVEAERDNCFDENLWCLNLSKADSVTIEGLSEDSEVAVIRTENHREFNGAIYHKDKVVREIRGENTMDDAGRRIVRTAMDVRLTPHSNIMFGEDVHFPGRWAGFPSHHHRQPEIYFYKFYPENGFGLLRLGDEGVLLEQNDLVKIAPNLVHPQVAAPGYAMYFLWIIRHLENDPYIKPTFEEQHLWVEKPGAKYWPEI